MIFGFSCEKCTLVHERVQLYSLKIYCLPLRSYTLLILPEPQIGSLRIRLKLVCRRSCSSLISLSTKCRASACSLDIFTGAGGQDLYQFESLFPLMVDTLIDCATGITGLLSNEAGGSGCGMGGGRGILDNLGPALFMMVASFFS